MQRFALEFDWVTTLKITIELAGNLIEESVIPDTGYTSPGGHGLSLPIGYEYIQQTNKKIDVKTGHDEDRDLFFQIHELLR
jgi:hypothetical protein